MYYSPTFELFTFFCMDCFICHERHPNVPLTKGAKKPILSLESRDRIQVHLIDMRVMRKRDIYENMQRWIMTVKDHSTGLDLQIAHLYEHTDAQYCRWTQTYDTWEVKARLYVNRGILIDSWDTWWVEIWEGAFHQAAWFIQLWSYCLHEDFGNVSSDFRLWSQIGICYKWYLQLGCGKLEKPHTRIATGPRSGCERASYITHTSRWERRYCVAGMQLIIYHTHWGPCDCSCCKRSALAEIDHCGCIKKNSNVPAHAFATEIVRETQTTVNELSVLDINFLLIMNSG